MSISTIHRAASGKGYASWQIGDTDAEKPSSGLVPGSLYYAVDTKRLYRATSATAWGELIGGGDGGLGTISQYPLISAWPWGGAPTTVSPVTHGASVAQVFPFALPARMTLNQVAIRTAAVVASCLQLAIFDSTGARVWTSGALSTVTGWTKTTASLPVALPAGTYYFATTNNGSASGTAAYSVTPTTGTADMPRWGTVAATGGAMPASITPTAIAEADLGFLAYVLLEDWTT